MIASAVVQRGSHYACGHGGPAAAAAIAVGGHLLAG